MYAYQTPGGERREGHWNSRFHLQARWLFLWSQMMMVDGVGLESEDKLMPNSVLCRIVLWRPREWRTVWCQKCVTWTYTVCRLSDKRLYVAEVGNDRHVMSSLSVIAKPLFYHSNK